MKAFFKVIFDPERGPRNSITLEEIGCCLWWLFIGFVVLAIWFSVGIGAPK